MNSSQGIHLRSPVFPGGSLLAAYYDREVTQLSDRGMASNLIGDRWSNVVAAHLAVWPGTDIRLPDGRNVTVDRVYRLDDIPAIAAMASKHHLQNPDFLVEGKGRDGEVVFAADAKFSVEMAKAGQVSATSLAALLELGPRLTDHLPGLSPDADLADGLFISPDSEISRYVMRQTRGQHALRVAPASLVLLPISPVEFLKPMEGARLMTLMASVDGYRDVLRTNMLLAMYAFRLARAIIGCDREMVTPIVGKADALVQDLNAIEQRTLQMAAGARSGWDLVGKWDAAAAIVREQRRAVQAVTSPTLSNKDLRQRIQEVADAAGVEAPSVNRVRKQIGGWYRGQVEEPFGTVTGPVDDFPSLLQRLEQRGKTVAQELPSHVEQIIQQAVGEMPITDIPGPG